MKKIVSSRVDELRKAKAEWEEEAARRSAIREREEEAREKVVDSIIAPIEDVLRTGLAKFNLLQFDITVRPYSERSGGKGASIQVSCDQYRRDEGVSLMWDYKAWLNEDFEVAKESGSWSGLNACTEAEMASLKQTVGALEFLNSLDYTTLLNVNIPSRSEFYSEESRMPGPKPDFDVQIQEAILEDAIGQDVLFQGTVYAPEDPEYGSNIWRAPTLYYKIEGQTEKQYRVSRATNYEINRSLLKDGTFDNVRWYRHRVRKDRLWSALLNVDGRYDSKVGLEDISYAEYIEQFNQYLGDIDSDSKESMEAAVYDFVPKA